MAAALWLWSKLYPLSLLDNQHYLTFIRIQNRSVRKVRLYGKTHSLPTLREYYKLISQNNLWQINSDRERRGLLIRPHSQISAS